MSRTTRPRSSVDGQGSFPLVGLGTTAIDPTLSVGEVAYAVLRKQFAAFVTNEPGTRLGDDPKPLHDMRVANRRMRAAMSLFRDSLPARMLLLRSQLRWVTEALGPVRDLDVQLQQLEDWSNEDLSEQVEAMAALRELLQHERAEARTGLQGMLDSLRYTRLLERLAMLLRTGPSARSAPSRVPILVAGPALVRRRYRALRKAGDRIGEGAEASEFHRVRIQGKRLRYTLEFLADVYPGQVEPLVPRLVALQDLLGAQQDSDVAVARLRALAGRTHCGLSPVNVFALGMLAERYAQRSRDLRASFPDVYAKVRGRPWKELRRNLKERMPVRAPAAPGSPA